MLTWIIRNGWISYTLALSMAFFVVLWDARNLRIEVNELKAEKRMINNEINQAYKEIASIRNQYNVIHSALGIVSEKQQESRLKTVNLKKELKNAQIDISDTSDIIPDDVVKWLRYRATEINEAVTDSR